MSNPLFLDSFALIKVWATGFFLFDLRWPIHLLLVVATMAFLAGLIYRKLLIQKPITVINKNEALHQKYGM